MGPSKRRMCVVTSAAGMATTPQTSAWIWWPCCRVTVVSLMLTLVQLSCCGAKTMTSCLLPAMLARQKMAVWIYSHVTQAETPWSFAAEASVTAQQRGKEGEKTKTPLRLACTQWGTWWCTYFFLLGSYLMFWGHRRHQTCNKLPVSHYNRSLLSHNDQASNKPLYRCCAWQKQSHQTSTGAKWQITPLPVWESLFHSRFSLSLFPFLDLFVSLSTRSPFLPLGLSSLSFLTPRCRLSVFLSAFILAAPLLFLLTFIFPISLNPSLRLSVTSCYLGRTWQLARRGERTMTYSSLSPLV